MRALSLGKLLGLAVAAATILGLTPAPAAATMVKKNISKDTVWKAKKSPYVVK